MVNPLDVLPLISGDTYTFINQAFNNEQVGPGERRTVKLAGEGVERGFYFGTVSTIIGDGGEDTELEITVDDFRADTTPKELYNSGFTHPQGIAPALSRYDTTNDIYTLIHNPQRTIGFNDTVQFSQRASNDSSDGVLIDATVFTIGILNPRKFVKEYLQLVNPRLIQEGGFDLADDNLDQFLDRFEQ